MLSLAVNFVILALTIALSAFFAATEISLVSLGKIRVRALVKANVKNSMTLSKLKKNQNQAIITILIANNIVNVIASSFATLIALELFGEIGIGIAVGFIAALIIVVGDIIPKTFATLNSEKLALLTAPILDFLVMLFSPVVKILNSFLEILFRSSKKEQPLITEKEIMDILAIGVEEKAIKIHEKEFFEKILSLGDIQVKQIMVPLEKFISFQTTHTVEEAFKTANHHTHLHFPVLERKKIVGTVRLKDIIRAVQSDHKNIGDITLAPVFIDESVTVDNVLKEMQAKKTHVVYITNKNKLIVGLVTISDIIEELVGEGMLT